MGGALQGFGTQSGYPTSQMPWGFMPQQSSQFGGPFGSQQVPHQLQQLQAAIHQVLQTEFTHQQQIQQLLQIVPQQLQQIQHLLQIHAYQQQPYQQQPYQQFQQPYQQQLYQQQPYQPQPYQSMPWQTPGFGVPSFGGQSFGANPSWLGTSQPTQPQLFGGQGGFGQGYVM